MNSIYNKLMSRSPSRFYFYLWFVFGSQSVGNVRVWFDLLCDRSFFFALGPILSKCNILFLFIHKLMFSSIFFVKLNFICASKKLNHKKKLLYLSFLEIISTYTDCIAYKPCASFSLEFFSLKQSMKILNNPSIKSHIR